MQRKFNVPCHLKPGPLRRLSPPLSCQGPSPPGAATTAATAARPLLDVNS